MINYSFIIPHKNSTDLLRKCLDSIPHRDDVQIIVVDDNSDVNKVDFKHFPGLNEKCTEVYLTKEGKGAGYARNVGLEHAVGKWIVFADADDFFNSEIEAAMNSYLESDSDVVFFMGNSIKIPSGAVSHRGESYNMALQIAFETGDFSKVLIMSTPWRKFFKKIFLQTNNIKFNEVRWSNDVVFMAKVHFCVKKCSASLLNVYCVTESDNTLTKSNSLECRIVRMQEQCKEVVILRDKYNDMNCLYKYQFDAWMNVYKINKLEALKQIPYCVYAGGLGFIKQMYIAKFGK